MKKKQIIDNLKTFSDFTQKSWITENDKIKVGDTPLEIMSGKFQIIEVKEILFGDTFQTWKIVIDMDDKTYLLKSSRELK